MSPIAPDSIVLVTGINGHIGSTVVLRLLEQGFRVRGTVRSMAKGLFMKHILSADSAYGDRSHLADKFQLVEIPDFTSTEAYSSVLDDVSGVVHIASPNTMDQKVPTTQAVPAVSGTLAILRAAAGQSSVRRVTLIGTIGSIIMNNKPSGRLVDPSDWNCVSENTCHNPDDPAVGFHCYLNSKISAEKSAWDFLSSNKPTFEMNVILPSIALGPVFHPVTGPPRPDVSLGNLWDYLGSRRSFAAPSVNVLWVHSYDVADCLTRTLTAPAAINERFICSGGKTSWGDVCDILRKTFPDRGIPPVEQSAYVPQFPGAEDIVCDTSRTEQILGIQWRTLDEAIVGASRDLVAREAYGWDK